MFYKKKRIYFDYASATPVRREALRAYEKASRLVGNPGSIHAEGVAAKQSLEQSRQIIAAELGCKAREIIFTSGLTEANNLAISGFARALEISGKDIKGTHWIVSSIEHPSVLECFGEVERKGGTVSHVDPDGLGRIAPERLKRALRENTVYVSIGWANSEIGTVQKLRTLAGVIREHEKEFGTPVIMHTDAGQAPLYLAPNVHTLEVDLFSLGSGKLYGPRGTGALYVGKRASLAPVIIGGGQERGLRAGTEAPALAAGFAAALVAVGKERTDESKRLSELRDILLKKITGSITGVILNGGLSHSLPHMLNVSIPNIQSEYVVLALDREGVALSTKAACSEGTVSASRVVAAICGDEEQKGWRAQNTLRFSLGKDTTMRDIEYAAKTLSNVLKTMPLSDERLVL